MKRYELDQDDAECPYMSEHVNGDYVLYSDVEKLVEALRFYERGDHMKDSMCETYFGKCSKDADNGEVARQALKSAHPQPNPADRGDG